ncbi:transposase [Nocardia sp. NPDC051787]|uniref:transposase n=1 Tax=Nocardia sp. NPDC051787 TaxID=3155415 RepID=UPI003425CFF9
MGKQTPEQHPSAGAVGVDRGVAVTLACSDGSMHDRAFTTVGERQRYRRLQQKLARQQKHSVNRGKTIAALRTLKRRETDRRSDFAAQVANWLATRHGVVVLEDLNIMNMTASAKGTRRARSRCRPESGVESRHPRQGVVPVRTGAGQRGPVHGHPDSEGPGRVHVAEVFPLPQCGPGKP